VVDRCERALDPVALGGQQLSCSRGVHDVSLRARHGELVRALDL
jgi:hypothetical protein